MIKITYIWHDCFVVELPQLTMIFDYWKDPLTKRVDLPLFIKELNKEKPLYVFVSHHHKDHFTKKIFEWEMIFEKIKYIISRDVARHIGHMLKPDTIYKGIHPKLDNIRILSSGECFNDSLLKIEAYGSTDIGNSYFIETKGEISYSFFHAGDLNAWLWKDESTSDEVREALEKFEMILGDIFSKHHSVDYAMFPVDSRIGTDYFSGARLFVNTIRTSYFFPMHFALGESEDELLKRAYDAAAVKLYANLSYGEYICLQAPYSVFAKY